MREKKRHLIEVHVAGICFRETENDIEVLIAKRREDRALYPEKWECGGGQVYAGESFVGAVKRQIKEELGIIVEKVIVFDTYCIKTPDLEQKVIPGIKFVCFFDKYVDGKGPVISEDEFSEWRWQSINSLGGIDFIQGIDIDIRKGWEYYNASKSMNSADKLDF
jgi:8-oxo-dGTP pyrophosphatase MutT (NUDIX family)